MVKLLGWRRRDGIYILFRSRLVTVLWERIHGERKLFYSNSMAFGRRYWFVRLLWLVVTNSEG
jgi:hypothetical protein